MNKVKIGMVGLHFGRHIVEADLVTDEGREFMELGGVCDLDADLTREVATIHGVKAFESLDAMLADPEIQAVGLFTGPAGRANLIRKAIRAGKHVMTTKPFECDPQAALEVLMEAKSLGKVVHLNSPSPMPPGYIQQIQDWRKEYGLGQPVAARSEVWVRYHEQPDGTWYDDPGRCPVAPVFRLGIYGINDILWLLGEPESVQVQHSRLFTKRPTADNGMLNIKFRNGALANVFSSFCVNGQQGYHVALQVNFENGTVYYKCENDFKLEVRPFGTGDPIVVSSERLDTNGSYQWRNLYRAIHGETLEGEVTPEQVVAAVRIANAMTRAQETGCTEAV